MLDNTLMLCHLSVAQENPLFPRSSMAHFVLASWTDKDSHRRGSDGRGIAGLGLPEDFEVRTMVPSGFARPPPRGSGNLGHPLDA